MGTIIHETLVVQIEEEATGDWPRRLNQFRGSVPSELQTCLAGPFLNPVYGGQTLYWTPDGAKEGHLTSNLANEWRTRLANVFLGEDEADVSIVLVKFGGDMDSRVTAEPVIPYCPCCTPGNHTEKCLCHGEDCCHPDKHS